MIWEVPRYSSQHSWAVGNFPAVAAAVPQAMSVARRSLVAYACAGAQPDSRQQIDYHSSDIDSKSIDAAASLYSLEKSVDAAASLSRCSHNRSYEFEADQLYVQCGRDALVVLSLQQLLQLTDSRVADVADAPNEASGSAACSTAPVAELGQQLDPNVSGGQQSVVSAC